MGNLSRMFTGDFLYYNLFMYSLIPMMAIFLFIPPITGFLILICYVSLFTSWMLSRALKKRKGKEGLKHFNLLMIRGDIMEEMILSFKNKMTADLDSESFLLGYKNIDKDPEYRNAKTFVLMEDSGELMGIKEYEKQINKYKLNLEKKPKSKEEDKTGKKGNLNLPPPNQKKTTKKIEYGQKDKSKSEKKTQSKPGKKDKPEKKPNAS